MEPEAQQLLAAIAAQPADDAPRLAYAGWLAARGDPRGEFIHAQCELARLSPGDPRAVELRGRERALLAEHGARWAGLHVLAGARPARVDASDPVLHLPGAWPDHGEIAVRFERGFPAELAANAGALARHAPAIAGLGAARVRATVWNEVAYTDWADDMIARAAEQESYDRRALDDMTALAGSPAVDRVTDLSLASAAGGYATHLGALLDLLVHGRFEQLERLTLDFGWLRAEHVAALAGWPGLAQLRSLGLIKASLSAALVRQLFGESGGGALAVLDLSSNELNADAAVALAEFPQLAGLTSLRLGGSRIGAAGLRALAAAPFWPGLLQLDLSGEWQVAQLGWPDRTIPSLGAEGFGLLLTELPRTQLAELALRNSALGDEAVAALAGAPGVAGMRRLDLFGNPIGDLGALALAESPHLAGLEYLRVYSQALSPVGQQALRERFGPRVTFGA